MNNNPLTISRLKASSPALVLCARWRHDAFGIPLEDSQRQLEQLTRGDQYDQVFLASYQNTPAGICMFVRNELYPAHDLSPWLASLYVKSEFRRHGIGSALVKAIETHARAEGESLLHLYTTDAEMFYRRCGWTVAERFDHSAEKFVLMSRDL